VETVVDGDGTIVVAVCSSDKAEGGCIGWAATFQRVDVGEEVKLAFLEMVWGGRLSACALVDSRTSERGDEA
jgi:hypothetical protein